MEICRFLSSFDIGAASVIGPHHEKNNLPNQDAFACFKSDQLIACAVADGIGSAKFSEQGSSYAVHLAVFRLIDYLFNRSSTSPNISDARHLKDSILKSWQMKFAKDKADYDTTLLFFGLTPKVCVLGQIGDGLILYQSSSQYVKFSSSQKDYLNTPDATLAHPQASDKFQIEEFPITQENSFNAFLLLTDGVADDLSDAEKYFHDLKRELLQDSSKQWTALLRKHLTDWQTPGHYDDKTLLIAIGENQVETNETQDSELQTETRIVEETAGMISNDAISPTITRGGERQENG